ncbi:MAG: serine/threonine protein kinase, partial [Deltaproteobacteria bacterium]
MVEEAMAAARDGAQTTDEADALARIRARMGLSDDVPTIGGYEIRRRIGSGAMGVVYLAWDPSLGRNVAIKLLSTRAPTEAATERLVREARGLARLQHPNVLTVFEVGRHDDRVFVVTEYAPGGDLGSYLRERRPSLAEILRIFVEAGRGLAAAHDAGLVHRDFKPANVLLDAEGRAKVADFGLVRVVTDESDAPLSHTPADATPGMAAGAGSTDAANLTRTGALVGTPAYMAPEVLQGAPSDPKSDQFAFCVALYEAVAGTRPFAGASLLELVESTESGGIAPPAAGRRVPRWLLRVLRRGLSRDPDARFPDMHALVGALERRTVRRRIAATAAFLAVGAFAGWFAAAATEEQQCETGTERIAAVWNDSVRSKVRDAFDRAHLPYGDSLEASVDAAFDAYAQRWAAAHRRACEETRIHGERSERALDLRMACLERRKRAFADAVDLVVHADAASLARSYDVAAGIPPVETCDDPEWLAEHGRWPDDPTRRAEAERIDREIVRAQAMLRAGKHTEAKERLAGLADATEALAWPPLSAKRDLVLGQVLLEAGEHQAADEALHRAFAAALETGADDVAAWTAVTGVHLAATRLRDPKAAETWWWLVAPLLERVPHDAWLHGAALANRANALLVAGDNERSIEMRRRAMEVMKTTFGPDDPRIAEQKANLAAAYRRMGEPERAVVLLLEAAATMRAAYGRLHPKLGQLYNNLGTAQLALRRLEDAQASYATSLEIKQATLPSGHPSLGHAYHNLGEVFLERGQNDDARASLERAHEIWRSALGPDHPLT